MAQAASKSKPAEEPNPALLGMAAKAKLLWGVLALYVLLVAWGIANHELWRDEGADWMAVRDLGLGDLLAWYVPQGGHPPLYYLVLFPLAKMGFPVQTVNLVSLVFMTGAVYLLLFKIKFPFFFKLTVPFSYFFLFEYGMIGRNYCVVVFMTMLLLRFYDLRFERPWTYALILAGLLNADSLMFPFSMTLVLLYWAELVQQKRLQAIYVWPAVAMSIAGLYIIPYMAMPGVHAQATLSKIRDHFAEISKTIQGAFILYNESPLVLLVFAAILALLICRPKAFFVMICGAAALLYLLAYVRIGDMRHRGLLLLEIIAAYGIAVSYESVPAETPIALKQHASKMIRTGLIVISCFLTYQVYAGFQAWKQDIDGNFSGGKDAASFIMENHLQHKIIIGQPSWAASAVMQYLPPDCKMYYADCERYGTFIIYDSLYEANQFRFSSNYGPYTAKKHFADSLDQVVLLLNQPISNRKMASEWNIVYYTKDVPMKEQESYFIYQHRKQAGSENPDKQESHE